MSKKQDNAKREPKYNQTRGDYRKNNSEEYRNSKKRYYANNKKEILESNRNWRGTFKGRLSTYKRGALSRNVDWSLTDKEFESFYNLNCYYCNTKIEGVGIDRLNSEKGYNIPNCVPCCYQCNVMKMDYSLEEFTNKIEKIWESIKKLKGT